MNPLRGKLNSPYVYNIFVKLFTNCKTLVFLKLLSKKSSVTLITYNRAANKRKTVTDMDFVVYFETTNMNLLQI